MAKFLFLCALLACALASLHTTSATAGMATPPLVQCQGETLNGVAACTVDMGQYAAGTGGVGPACPAGVTSSTTSLLCEESFAAALSDARKYFTSTQPAGNVYVITIPAGQFDFSVESEPLAGLHGAIDVSGIAPGGPACLLQTGLTQGVVALSGNGCLVITGAGAANTMLTTAHGVTGIYGKNVSHMMFENMTMVQPDVAATQGTYVSQGSTTIDSVVYNTLTLDFTPGLPSPLDLFKLNCSFNHRGGCSPSGVHNVSNDIYMRAYTNEAAPQLIQSIAGEEDNAQLWWGYPIQNNVPIAAAPPTQPNAREWPNRWTLTFSQPQSMRGVPSYYSGTTNFQPNLICMKVDDAEAFTFNALPAGGTDIILNNMVWSGAGRGTFRGIKGAVDGSVFGAQVINSAVARATIAGGSPQCLSTQSGGLQIGQPGDPAVYGNLVYGFTAQGTADDSVAIFNDKGGVIRDHVKYPLTMVLQSNIGNSFARDILLWNNERYTRITGNSPVYVDAATQNAITSTGNCDSLVLGAGQCPVTYLSQ